MTALSLRLPRRLAAGAAIMAAYLLLRLAWAAAAGAAAADALAADALAAVAVASPLPGLLLAVTGCALAASRLPAGSAERRAWEFIGAAYVVWSAGSAARIYFQIALGQGPPLPSLSGLLLLAGHPLAILGLLRLTRGPSGRLSQMLPVLDIALTVTAAGVFAWHFVLGEQIRQAGADLTELAWTLTHDIAYLALAGALIAFFLRSTPRGLRTLAGLVAAGLALRTLADWGLAYLTVGGQYAPGHPIEAGWLAGDLLVAFAAFYQAETRVAPVIESGPTPAAGSSRAGAAVRLAQIVLPFIGPLLVAGFLIDDSRLPLEQRDPSLAWGLLLAMIILAVRQAVAGSEQQRLYSLVAARQAELDGLVRQLLSAQEDERRRVAYDLHDGLTQLLVSAHLHLEALAAEPELDAAEARAKLARAEARVSGALEEARRVTSALRPSTLDDLGLVPALHRHLAEQAAEAGWETEFVDGLAGARLDPHVETTVFRIAQEALSNVRRHAAAARVRVALLREGGELVLDVRDWGRGFAAGRPGPGGHEPLGLAGMQERSRLLGGRCRVHSAPGEGTTVEVRIPLAGPGPGAGREGL